MSASQLAVIALVSVGAHPSSGRPRRAEQDARAVELGLQLAGERLQLLHAGDAQADALRAYLGMGLSELNVLQQAPGADALPALLDYLRGSDAQLVLTGSQAETGEGSGMLPFLLAEQLGWPLVVGLAAVESLADGYAQVLQALPRGQRRRLKVPLPFLASVDNAAPAARQSAFGPARRGLLNATEVERVDDELLAASQLQPAKSRPKRLKIIKAKTGAERMKAATAKAVGGGGQVLSGLSPQDSAEAIFKLLLEEGVLR
ncbi:MAG: electron transfer flavoprotein subunit beta [Pseudomonadales bacterium RIFCSPLOWO2_12_59_9]|nr:MAG: electron transfer flavoprotein subunit beta [Pseudomonadales bacterium RIFCSPLOWO2_12_59_9]